MFPGFYVLPTTFTEADKTKNRKFHWRLFEDKVCQNAIFWI